MPRTIGLPWAAAFAVLGGDAVRAVERYEEWLLDAEAPAAWHLAQLCRAYAKLGDAAGVFRSAARFHPWDLEGSAREDAARALDHARRRAPGGASLGQPFRLALLGTFNTHPLVASLRVGAARLGLDLDLYHADYDQLRVEIVNPASGLYRHDPEAVILATTSRDLRIGTAPEAQADEWCALWETLLGRSSAQILQHTFDRPEGSALGHLEVRSAESPARIADSVNALLADRAPPRVSFVDYVRAQRRCGTDLWCDPRQWFWAKEAVSPAAAPFLAEEYLAVLSALTGRSRKVLVLDLDNTLWGGIVGEDGVEGLAVGPPSATGEAHQELQRYGRALADRGVLLAVCSKNDRDAARSPFREIADMVLGLDDFVAFRASWSPKPQEIRSIAADLNLGLDSIVFVDDNPVERALMRRECPEVLTVPLPDDPAGFVRAIDAARAFEVLAVSAEDRTRAESYRAESRRRDVAAVASSPQDFLASLEMQATVRPFAPADTTRIVQLAGRSNQFNLTTWRLTNADVERLVRSPRHATMTVRLRDRFGDYGLVAIVVAEARDDELDVTEWAMSCRVIGRGVEDLVLAELERAARSLGRGVLVGRYVPTKKNGLVRDLYDRLGFERVTEEADGPSVWRREVGAAALTDTTPFCVRRPEEEEPDE